MTEPGNGYARVAVTFGAPAPAGVVANDAEVLFPQATPGDQGNVTHGAIMDALTGGNARYYGPLATPQNITAGNRARFPIGSITVTET